MKSWKCKLGFHCWHTVESRSGVVELLREHGLIIASTYLVMYHLICCRCRKNMFESTKVKNPTKELWDALESKAKKR